MAVASDVRAHLRHSRTGAIGLALTVGFVTVAFLGPLLPGLPDPAAQDLENRLAPPVGWGGTWSHPLGTDQLGRDLLARIVDGARVSVTVGLLSVLLASAIGVTVGLMAGYRGGIVDTVMMSIADVQVAFPGILAGLILVAAWGPGMLLVVAVIAMSGWMVFARVTRGLVHSLKTSLYVEAGRLNGLRPGRIMRRHLLPNLVSPLVALAVLEFAAAILSESALSFAGLGVQPPESSWGLIIAQGRTYVTSAWWIIAFAGAAIALAVLGTNLVALWLQSFANLGERERTILGGGER